MALVFSNVTSGIDADGNSSSSTASITPDANALILLSVTSRNASSLVPNAPTASGNGLTWVQVGTIYWDTDSSTRKTTTLLRAMGASPSAGAISIDFGGQNQTNVGWSVDQVTGVDTSGTNGSGAVLQATTGKDETTGGGTFTITLGSFSSVNNGTFACFGSDSDLTVTDFTALADVTSSFHHSSIYKTTNDTSVTENYAVQANSKIGGIAIEVKMASAATAVKDIIGMGIIPFAR